MRPAAAARAQQTTQKKHMTIRKLAFVAMAPLRKLRRKRLTQHDMSLLAASCNGMDELARESLANGASLGARDSQGRQALHCAAANGHAPTIRLLLEAGADPNATDDYGDTPLSITAAGGYDACAIALLEARPRLNTRNAHGQTPLINATMADSDSCAQALAAAGADPNILCDEGYAPLHFAAALGRAETCKKLIDAGALPAPKSGRRDSQTPADLARLRGHDGLAQWLESIAFCSTEKAQLADSAFQPQQPPRRNNRRSI